MLKFVSMIIARLEAPADVESHGNDLLLHPALRDMSLRELADLPLRQAARHPGGCESGL